MVLFDSPYVVRMLSKMDASQKELPALVLYRGFPVSTSYVWSPFVTKLEARLRFARLKYRLDQGSMSQAPRGKVPYIEITPNGQDRPLALGDSSLIIQHLVDNDICDDLNESLPPAARAHDMALRALFEEKLYFYQVSIFNIVCRFRKMSNMA